MMFLIDSLKKLTNFYSGIPLNSLVDFLQCTFLAGFQNNQDHRRVTEQLSETQAVIRKPEQDLWLGLLEGISQILSDFTEAFFSYASRGRQ